jgi:hypothetical protein
MSIKIEAFKNLSNEKLRELSVRLQKSYTDERVRKELPPFLSDYVNKDDSFFGYYSRISRCVKLIDVEVVMRFHSGIIN